MDKRDKLGPTSEKKFNNLLTYFGKQGYGPETSKSKAGIFTRESLDRRLATTFKKKGVP